jgi:thiol:disulfide interchange protein DsbA
MGKVNQMQSKVFTALQTEKKRLDKPDVLFPWIADQGVDRAEFEKAYKSFGVATAIRKAAQLQEAYQVEGTPALGIAGKYYTDPTLTSGFDSMLKVANTLIAQERKKG